MEQAYRKFRFPVVVVAIVNTTNNSQLAYIVRLLFKIDFFLSKYLNITISIMKQAICTKQRRSKVKAAFKTPACAVPIKGHMRHLLMDALRNTNCLKCVSELYLQQVCCKCQKDICSSCMLLSFDGETYCDECPIQE